MQIVMCDDSVPFDADTPLASPLGGAARGFVHLACALAELGYKVTVLNRCKTESEIKGVLWRSLAQTRKLSADILIAFRRPSLLEAVSASTRFLWLADHAKYLGRPENKTLLDRYGPTLIFLGPAHQRTWKEQGDLSGICIAPGIADPFRLIGEVAVDPPEAVVTARPGEGLERVLNIWASHVRSALPEARLRIFSSGLSQAKKGKAASPMLVRLAHRIDAITGVGIEQPGGEEQMAKAYARARAHLYPASNREVYPWTLAESQAVGCPAVTFPHAACAERVRNGETGYLVPDDVAFANLVIEMLRGGGAYHSISTQAREKQSSRDWSAAAREFAAVWNGGNTPTPA